MSFVELSGGTGYMFHSYAFIEKGIYGFLIPTTLGIVAYVAATLTAKHISKTPWRLYISRIALLTFFALLLLVLVLPACAEAFTGTRYRSFESALEAKGMGMMYGMHTLWIWFIIALLKRPKLIPHEKAS